MHLFSHFIQMIDGRENKQLKADGFIVIELSGILGMAVISAYAIDTPTGTISLFCEPRSIFNRTEGCTMKTWLILIASLAAQPVLAHPGAEHTTAVGSEISAVTAILSAYKSAVERLDATGTEQLFTADSAIFESGGVEGTYSNYLAHHLTPELKEFKSFAFSNYRISVRFEGSLALATESYNYRIETKAGEIAERVGVATSVLKKVGGQWKIVSMHNSSRRPAVR